MRELKINGTKIMSNKITINGVKILNSSSINVINGKVIIDSVDVTPDEKEIRIEVQGNVDQLSVDVCNTIAISGDCVDVSTQCGDVSCGSVSGSVKTMSGDVSCGAVSGDIRTMSGDVNHRS